MPTPSSPFDPLLPLLAAAQRIGVTTWGWPAQIEITFNSGAKVPLPISPLPPNAAAVVVEVDFRPTAAQWKMIHAVAGGKKMSKKQLAATAGDKVYLRAHGGVDELERAGIFVAVTGGFELSDLGNAMRAEELESEE